MHDGRFNTLEEAPSTTTRCGAQYHLDPFKKFEEGLQLTDQDKADLSIFSSASPIRTSPQTKIF